MAIDRDRRLQTDIDAVTAEIDSLFREDRHPVNDGSITSMSEFLAVIRKGQDANNFPEIETAEQAARAASELDHYKLHKKTARGAGNRKRQPAPSPS